MLQDLQEDAKRVLNSAFNNSFVKKLSQYLHDCVREEVKSATFRNLKGDKDNKWIFLKQEETLFTKSEEFLRLDGADSKLTELMIQSENNTKDKYLIYGYLFLVGKNSKTRRQNEFLTPLLYVPCRLERNGVNINCIPLDDVLSLNTAALAGLMAKRDDEDEIDLLLEGILDAVPDLPITQEKMDIFLTTLKSIVPDVEIALNVTSSDDEDNVSKDFYEEKINSKNIDEILDEEEEAEREAKEVVKKVEHVSVTNQSAIILTKRPSVTAGVLHELMQIAEKPSGMYRETALGIINEEFAQSKEKSKILPELDELKDFYPITPLSLSDTQERVLRNITSDKFIAVQGPPGTGKSQTIVNLVAHLIAQGKTVLVASRMDKAVDVVADRLNSLGAQFLALRAGRLNYQRQLSYDLQDLLAGKVDLDEGAEDYLTADVKDMKEHLDNLRELEKKCDKIINLEKKWHDMYEQSVIFGKSFDSNRFITKFLNKDEIEIVENSIENFEKNSEKSGFFANLSNRGAKKQLIKLLNLHDFDITLDSLQTLKEELEFAKHEYELKKIELEIQKSGNIHVMIEQIRQMKKKQAGIAVNILKNQRRQSLKGLLKDQVKRQRLKIHARSLVERKQRLQNNILEEEDFKPLLEAFPCWCATTYAISSSLPLKPAMFDVAIIDEASQCDIASCFPILFRAKKAVIVGDDKQLPHLSFLEKAKEQSFMNQYGIPDKYQLMWRFRTNSMFDVSDYYSMNSVMLDEHFRSLPPIIDFSNQEFYGGRIRIMRKDKVGDKVLELVQVPDGKVDNTVTRNLPEIEAVVKMLHELIVEDERKNPDKPVSIGIISPFRAQVEQLKISVSKVISDHMLKKHQVEIGTAHTFQGDERDIMLISWAFAENSHTQSLTFLQKSNLFNVAITRAKNKLINFISHDISNLPEGHFRNYMAYLKHYQERQEAILNNEIDENIYKNSLEKEIATELRNLGKNVVAGTDIAGLSADLLFDKTIVEVDGVEDEPRERTKNMKKQSILERSGYNVKRVSYREWKISKTACINRLLT
ncbi:MAG: AAA domain-containing protein [Candidatus Gastranaerophilaceae bacterium]